LRSDSLISYRHLNEQAGETMKKLINEPDAETNNFESQNIEFEQFVIILINKILKTVLKTKD